MLSALRFILAKFESFQNSISNLHRPSPTSCISSIIFKEAAMFDKLSHFCQISSLISGKVPKIKRWYPRVHQRLSTAVNNIKGRIRWSLDWVGNGNCRWGGRTKVPWPAIAFTILGLTLYLAKGPCLLGAGFFWLPVLKTDKRFKPWQGLQMGRTD